MAFQIETGRYFIYPSVSLTTCFSEAGVHGDTSSIGQTTLLSGKKKYDFKPFDELSCYDIYGTNHDVYKWMGMSEDELCVDFNGCQDNKKKCRFILSPYQYPYCVVRSYALSLFPIELNLKFQLEGSGLYLYDTLKAHKARKNPPLSLAYYYLKNFNIRLMARYAVNYTFKAIAHRVKKYFHAGKHK